MIGRCPLCKEGEGFPFCARSWLRLKIGRYYSDGDNVLQVVDSRLYEMGHYVHGIEKACLENMISVIESRSVGLTKTLIDWELDG